MDRSWVILVAVAALVGCSDNNKNGSPNNISFDRDTGTNPNNTTTQADTGAPVDMAVPPDMGEPGDVGEQLDFAVQAPGFMHGSWAVSRTADQTPIATLSLRHEAGETNVQGTFQMTEPPAFGELGGSNWIGDSFTTSWTVRIDGFDERFGLAMCARAGSDDQLACQHSDPLTGNVVDATMVRN